MSKTNYPIEKIDWEKVEELSRNIAKKIKQDKLNIDLIVPILRGGMPAAMFLSSMLNVSEMACIHIRRSVDDNPNTEFKEPINNGITNFQSIKDSNVLIVDDTLDSKKTLDYAINLIENAIKYNVPDGSVFLDLHGTEDEVQFTVTDTGIGIPENETYNIFGRFYRVDKARSREAGGSGLGLSIVHDAVKAHGGSIIVGQNKPQGSVFAVTFPRPGEDETGI